MSNMDGFHEERENAFSGNDAGVFTGVRCPDCDVYMNRDGKWLYCLECGYDEEDDDRE